MLFSFVFLSNEISCCLITVLVNGNYGKWSSWSICSKTCGRGLKKRIRECNDPLPSNGGKDCYEQGLGSSEERAHCFERSCPRKLFRYCQFPSVRTLKSNSEHNFLTSMYFLRYSHAVRGVVLMAS